MWAQRSWCFQQTFAAFVTYIYSTFSWLIFFHLGLLYFSYGIWSAEITCNPCSFLEFYFWAEHQKCFKKLESSFPSREAFPSKTVHWVLLPKLPRADFCPSVVWFFFLWFCEPFQHIAFPFVNFCCHHYLEDCITFLHNCIQLKWNFTWNTLFLGVKIHSFVCLKYF